MTAWNGAIPEDLTPPPAGHPAAAMVVGAAWEEEKPAEEPRFPDPFAT